MLDLEAVVDRLGLERFALISYLYPEQQPLRTPLSSWLRTRQSHRRAAAGRRRPERPYRLGAA